VADEDAPEPGVPKEAPTEPVASGPPTESLSSSAAGVPSQPSGPRRAWHAFRGWPYWVQAIAWVVVGIIIAGLGSSSSETELSANRTPTTAGTIYQCADGETQDSPCPKPTTTKAPTTTKVPTTTEAPTSTATQPPPTTAPPTTKEPFAGETASQRNARQKAADYLDFTSFSRSGLIAQLEYDGFTQEDAAYGVDALNVDWNEQAAKKAADYLDFTSFSRRELIEQLMYDGFTQAQAEYGVGTTGL
jgi:hypothetical protein